MDSILNPLYIAVSWVIVTIHKALTPIFGTDSGVSWSLAIIGLVIIIRIILIPLFVKQIKSQRALTALQPHMKEIQKKYKDDRQKQSEEMMKLYKEHKTNPHWHHVFQSWRKPQSSSLCLLCLTELEKFQLIPKVF
jgi:YidC/Oxa1 family membrane protein insertase